MTELTRKLVDAVGNAFNANDIDAVMQYFAPNAIFDHAVGADEHGVRFEGADLIRTVFQVYLKRLKMYIGKLWLVVLWVTRLIVNTAELQNTKTVAVKDI